MTAAETLEYAQASVDQIERGIGFVQDRLAQAENLAGRLDEAAATASDVSAKARRGSKYVLLVAGVAIVGITILVIARRRAVRQPAEEPAETTTDEETE